MFFKRLTAFLSKKSKDTNQQKATLQKPSHEQPFFVEKNSVKIYSVGLTDTGLIRESNQDRFLIDTDSGLFIVADGMGGHKAGEVASKMAAESFVRFLSAEKVREIRRNPAAIQHTIISGFYKVNQDVMDEGARTKVRKGMGCTLVTCFVDGDWAYVAHVGDVRCYHLDNGKLHQVTTDHSTITDTECIVDGEQVHKKKNVVTMGIGFPFSEDPELHQISTLSEGNSSAQAARHAA